VFFLVFLQLIKVNQPDMVLFVGESLVGNEAVDQVVKFNQARRTTRRPTSPASLTGLS
jgi:signal recognition particle receptor subunit alpha